MFLCHSTKQDMKTWFVLFSCFLLVSQTRSHPQDEDVSNEIKAILQHYKQPDPVGLPNVDVPDPFPIPDRTEWRAYAKISIESSKVEGLSKFRIDTIEAILDSMQLNAVVKYDSLVIVGNYTLTSFRRTSGQYNVTLKRPTFIGRSSFAVARQGNLEVYDLDINVQVGDVAVNITNKGFVGAIVEGLVNTLGTAVFDMVKPYMLKEFNARTRAILNEKLLNVERTFPNSIPPFDMAVAWGRKYVRDMAFDPYRLENLSHSVGIFTFDVKDIGVLGLATVYRAGNISLVLHNTTLKANAHFSSKRLTARCKIEISVRGFFPQVSTVTFTAEYIQIDVAMSQGMDLQHKPELDKLQIKIGNLQLRMDGMGTLDYVGEMAANILPNLLRYQIADALEATLRKQAEDYLETINIEQMLDQNISNLDGYLSSNKTETQFNPIEPDTNYEVETANENML